MPEFSSPWRKQFFHKKVISNFDIICRFHGKEKRMSHFWNSDSRLTWMIHLKIISEREILLSGKYENERKTSSSLSTDKLNISRIWNIEWKTIQRCYSNCYRGNYLECDASCIQNLFFIWTRDERTRVSEVSVHARVRSWTFPIDVRNHDSVHVLVRDRSSKDPMSVSESASDMDSDTNSCPNFCPFISDLKVSEDVLEPGENRETIRAECNAMLKKGFYFQIEKIRDENSIDKKFNYTFVCTNKLGFHIDAFW